MAKRGSRPPLYELMKARQAPAPGSPHVQAEDASAHGSASPAAQPERSTARPDDSFRYSSSHSPSRETEPLIPLRWLTPGVPITIPTGYIFLSIAGVLIVLVMIYMLGFHRGETKAEGEFDRTLLDTARDPDLRSRDPLSGVPEAPGVPEATRVPGVSGASTTRANQGVDRAGVTNRQDDRRSGSSAAAATQPSQRPAFRPRSEWGPIDAPRREPGKWYFLVATTVDSGAMRLAEFIRQEGVEAYVDCSRGANRCQVIVFPELPSGSRSDPMYLALDEALSRIARKWQSERRGGDDLKSRLPVRYTG